MSNPKRHHWWPQLQSGYWTGSDGFVNAVKADGNVFKASPLNIGFEGELYTRFEMTGERDVSIEKWFGREIESPFSATLKQLSEIKEFSKSSRPPGIPKSEIEEYKSLGFIWTGYRETIPVDAIDKQALVNYISALLVRNPKYLRKLYEFHKENNSSIIDIGGKKALKTAALDNMLYMFGVYKERISKSILALVLAEGDKELMFPDNGMTATEPWKGDHLPFTIHAPLTPRIALEVVPLNIDQPNPTQILVSRLNPQGVARYNRLALSCAERFIFCRNLPPIDFIRANFGKAAPAPYAYRVINGQLETKYDLSLDRPS